MQSYAMYLNKLTSTLALMNSDKMQAFADFVHSPYFRVPQNGIDLFDYMYGCYPKFTEKKINLEVIGKKVPSLNNGNKQAKAATEIMKALELFLAHEIYNRNKDAIAIDAINGYRSINAYDLAVKEIDHQAALLAERIPNEFNYFLHAHNLKATMFDGYDSRIISPVDTAHKDFSPIIHTLDIMYAVKKLRYFNEIIHRKNGSGVDNDLSPIPGLLKMLEAYNNEQFPYVFLVTQTCLMMMSTDFEQMKSHYYSIKNYIDRNTREGKVTDTELECSYHTIGQAAHWIRREEVQGAVEYLWWTNWRMKHNLMLVDGKLLPVVFRNVVSCSVIARADARWIHQFLIDYAPYMPGGEHKWVEEFSWGLYYYYIKEHDKAARCFSGLVLPEDIVARGMIRRWQFINLYEADHNDPTLQSGLAAFEKHLSRNKEAFHVTYPVFLKMVSYYRKLLDVKNIDTTIAQLSKEEPFTSKPWIEAMLQERKKELVKRKRPAI